MNVHKICSVFAVIIGSFLIIEGTWGLFSQVVFGVLTTNKTHAAIHIILGVAGIYFGTQGGVRSYCIFLGSLLLAVGVLFFINGADELIIRLINVNKPVAYLNIFLGIISLVIAMISSEKKTV